MRAICIEIYKPRSGDCSNNGISGRFRDIYIEHPRGNYEFDDNNLPENFCKVVERNIFGNTYLHIEPVKRPDHGCVGWMYGGCNVDSSDGRFHDISRYPLHLHDRQETQEFYYSMD